MSDPRTRILVADDEQTARLLMQATLERFGFEVCLAEDGEAALRAFRACPCALVVLDIEMPGLNGYDTCARLRQEAGDELPIVMVTGMDDVRSVERAFEAGATDFIAKPVNWALIGHRVRYLLRAHRVLQDLHAANARNAATLEAIPDLLFELDLEGRYIDFHSPRSDLLTAPPEHFIGRMVTDVLPAEAAQICLAALHEADRQGCCSGPQFRLSLPQGSRLFELSVSRKTKADGGLPHFIVLSRDITEREEAESRIHRLAYFDAVTGLPNRLFFSERLERELQRARHEQSKLAVLFMDLDRFKDVNDTLGHGTGDVLLQLVAERLRKGVRPADLVARIDAPTDFHLARLGGDEFSLLMPQLRHGDSALGLAHRIHQLMRRPFVLEGQEVVVTVSIGIALYPDDGADAASLLKHADTAMYYAKDQGRDTCRFYSASLTAEAMRRLELESSLHLALERDEFFLAYQPQLDLASGTIRSVEALLRWQHPRHGLISPAEFIRVAEENCLIVQIGEWVLRQACHDAARWQAAGHPLRVAVNLSAVQFRSRDLVAKIPSILRQTGLAAELLELELTEGALMEDSSTTLDTLEALRALGLEFALDDFGTGYSSLSYLKRLPLNSLKIDQSFVRGLPADAESLAIVCAIVALAKSLGYAITAEGIETPEQARILHDMGCDTLQGYHVGRPMPAADLAVLLARQARADDHDDIPALEPRAKT